MIAFAETDPLDPVALDLIGGSEAELSALYAPEHRFAFSPQELVEARVRFLVARVNGAAMGCGGLAPCDGYGELKRIYVRPAARGTGLAPAIVGALEGLAREMGLPLVRLETGSASPAAVALYTKCGYRRGGPFGDYAENGSSIFMEKAL